MLRWAILFLIVAIIAGVFGFGGISAAATDIARLQKKLGKKEEEVRKLIAEL